MELRQYIEIIWKHRWMIILLLVCAVAASAIVSETMTPIYQASTTILLKTDSALQNPLQAMLQPDKSPVADSVEILKSRTLLYAVARRHNLADNETSPELAQLQKSVTIQPVINSNLIRIQVESPSPATARDVANDIVSEFIARDQFDNTTDARGAKDFVGDQIAIVSQELASAEDDLRQYKKTHQVFAPEEETKAALDQVAKLEALKTDTAVSLNETGTRIDQLNRQLARQKQTIVSATTITANPVIQDLQAKLSGLEVELSGARQKYTDKHPTVLALLSQIEEVKNRMKQEAERVVSAQTETVNPMFQELQAQVGQLQIERLALNVRSKTLANLIAKQDERFAQMPDKELELTNLMRNAKVAEETYMMLKQKYEEVRITEAMKASNVRVVDPAITPNKPVRPRKTLNVAIAAFLALFVGVSLAFMIEYMDTSIKTSAELEEALGLPVLGQIPSYLPSHVRKMQRGQRS